MNLFSSFPFFWLLGTYLSVLCKSKKKKKPATIFVAKSHNSKKTCKNLTKSLRKTTNKSSTELVFDLIYNLDRTNFKLHALKQILNPFQTFLNPFKMYKLQTCWVRNEPIPEINAEKPNFELFQTQVHLPTRTRLVRFLTNTPKIPNF